MRQNRKVRELIMARRTTTVSVVLRLATARALTGTTGQSSADEQGLRSYSGTLRFRVTGNGMVAEVTERLHCTIDTGPYQGGWAGDWVKP